jgi:hypothetical protein
MIGLLTSGSREGKEEELIAGVRKVRDVLAHAPAQNRSIASRDAIIRRFGPPVKMTQFVILYRYPTSC